MNKPAPDVPRGTSLAAPAATPPAPIFLGPGILIRPLLQLQDELVPFDANAEDVEGQAARAEITDQTSYQAGSDLITAVQGQLRDLEALRVGAKRPADDYGKMVQKLVTPLQERFEAAKRTLSGKMLTWRNAEERKQREEQARIRKQQEEEAAALAAAARQQGNESTAERIEEMVAAAPADPAPKIGHANVYGRTSQKRTYWNGEPIEPMAILRAIIEGKIPISAVEFNKSTLNKIAGDYSKTLTPKEIDEFPAHGVVTATGIKITKDEKLV